MCVYPNIVAFAALTLEFRSGVEEEDGTAFFGTFVCKLLQLFACVVNTCVSRPSHQSSSVFHVGSRWSSSGCCCVLDELILLPLLVRPPSMDRLVGSSTC